MKLIKSFTVNHDTLCEGLYVSRRDGNTVTYDLRMKKPNGGDYLTPAISHTLEHLCAMYLRNSDKGDGIVYFGPMGCQTGFYLLVRNADNDKVLSVLKKCLRDTITYEGEVFGAKRAECGNYKNLSLDAAKAICRDYLKILESRDWSFSYDRF